MIQPGPTLLRTTPEVEWRGGESIATAETNQTTLNAASCQIQTVRCISSSRNKCTTNCWQPPHVPEFSEKNVCDDRGELCAGTQGATPDTAKKLSMNHHASPTNQSIRGSVV